MDVRQQRPRFYGTPLSQALADDYEKNETPQSSRRARLNQQQTVRDAQGRQRFHGAFTGGFSAGYYNTVGSIEGFKPAQFISRRGERGGRGTSQREDGGVAVKYNHRPEDYMDEEDFGEFGIAPRKLRVNATFCADARVSQSVNFNIGTSSRTADDTLNQLLAPAKTSLGASILKRMSSNRTKIAESLGTIDCWLPPTKDDFHGLGYRSLRVESDRASETRRQPRSARPLAAVIEGGKRLRISGEAFGTGALDDEDDDMFEHQTDSFSDMRNQDPARAFNIPQKAAPSSDAGSLSKNEKHDCDINTVPGFAFTGLFSATDHCMAPGNCHTRDAPEDWIEPIDNREHITPMKSKQIEKAQSTASLFGKKFASASSTLRSEDAIATSGLVTYTDLKAAQPIEERAVIPVTTPSIERTEVNIIRQILEWRPCSLLCKRFNVPNPFPETTFFGVRPTDLAEETKSKSSNYAPNSREDLTQLASIDLRQAVFNVTFSSDGQEENLSDTSSDNSEDFPQIVNLSGSPDTGLPYNQTCASKPASEAVCEPRAAQDECSDQEILELPVKLEDPEVIFLSDSSSSVATIEPSLPGSIRREESDDDSYGPPLPPTLERLAGFGSSNKPSRRYHESRNRRARH